MTSEPMNNAAQTRDRALSLALRHQGICVLHQDAGGRFDLAENLPPVWPAPTLLGRTVDEALPSELAAQFLDAIHTLSETGDQPVFDFELRQGTRRWLFEARLSRDSIQDGRGLTAVITDVTEARNRETAMATLLREVSHRSKNLLAIVQSVAMQTAHHSDGVKDFLDKFRGRLHALSSTQDLVTESNWRGTYFQSLVSAQLSRVGPSVLREMRITGDNPLLTPNASLHIGLALHELAANAVIHGTVAADSAGHIWIDARIDHEQAGEPARLVIEWQEVGMDKSMERKPGRFGTLVLERIVPLSVGGTARYTLEPGRVDYRLTVPADQFEG